MRDLLSHYKQKSYMSFLGGAYFMDMTNMVLLNEIIRLCSLCIDPGRAGTFQASVFGRILVLFTGYWKNILVIAERDNFDKSVEVSS